jgi:hypothetical protein
LETGDPRKVTSRRQPSRAVRAEAQRGKPQPKTLNRSQRRERRNDFLMNSLLSRFPPVQDIIFWRFPPTRFFPKKKGQIAGFGPSDDKKMHVLQSVFHRIPRNPMMVWN